MKSVGKFIGFSSHFPSLHFPAAAKQLRIHRSSNSKQKPETVEDKSKSSAEENWAIWRSISVGKFRGFKSQAANRLPRTFPRDTFNSSEGRIEICVGSSSENEMEIRKELLSQENFIKILKSFLSFSSFVRRFSVMISTFSLFLAS
jgi:hypothetical protein